MCVYVCVCTCLYSHEMSKCENVIYFDHEKITCIYLCFLPATKFAVTLCLIKHQVVLVLQMAICTYKTPYIKPRHWVHKRLLQITMQVQVQNMIQL